MIGYAARHTLREKNFAKAYAQLRAFLETHTDCKGATGARGIIAFDKVPAGDQQFEFRTLADATTSSFDGGADDDPSWLRMDKTSGGQLTFHVSIAWADAKLSTAQAAFYDALLATTGVKASANGFVAYTDTTRRRVKFDRAAFAGATTPKAKTKAKAVKPAANGASLLAAIYADPSDDAERLVYADYLSERGDPRGELIVLQCNGTNAKREQTLLRAHTHEWLGAVAPYVLKPSVVFTRGFLAKAALNPVKCASRNGLAKIAKDPAWSTVESLTLDSSLHAASPDALIGHPHLRALREFRWTRGAYVSEWSPEYLDVDTARTPLEVIIDAESGDGPTHCVWTRTKSGWSRKPAFKP